MNKKKININKNIKYILNHKMANNWNHYQDHLITFKIIKFYKKYNLN